jgi:lactoylglutathione lyase
MTRWRQIVILDYLVLYTADPLRLARFYCAALGLSERLQRFEGQYIELEAGGLTLAICGFDLRDKTLPEAARSSEGQAPLSGASRVPRSAGPADDFIGELAGGSAGIAATDSFQLSFRCDDLKAAYPRTLTAGAVAVAAPALKPWRCEVALVRDPDGRLIELCRRLEQTEAV